MSAIMRPYTSIISGAFVARCPRCNFLCLYWDEEDLDDEGNLLCWCDTDTADIWPRSTCRHCGRYIVHDPIDGWVDPEASGDDSVWRETCDEHDTFIAEHEPTED